MTHSIRYSDRFPASFEASRFARLVEERRAADPSLLDLTVSNPTAALSGYPHSAISEALCAVRDFAYEPDPFGLRSSRKCISGLYADTNVNVGVDRIALTASTSEAYSFLFRLLCDPGDEILVPTPSYPLFEHLAIFDGVRSVPYQLQYDGVWHIDFSSLERQLSKRTRAVVVVNPNNPTGSFLKAHEAIRLAEWAETNRLPIISDEVFAGYRWSGSKDIIDTFCRLPEIASFSLDGLSKYAGMPQMKLGWIVLNGNLDHVTKLRPKLELLLDTYLPVSWPVQKALPSLLPVGDQIREQLCAHASTNRAHLQDVLANSPVHLLKCEGGWTAILQLPFVRSEQEWVEGLLLEQSVLVQPGFFFDMQTEPYIVVSLITQPDVFVAGVAKIASQVQQVIRG